MTFAAPIKHETPQTVLEKQLEMGARLILTIPFGVPTEEMQGFISIMGSKKIHEPVMTICVGKPTGGSIISTIVFDSTERFTDFVDKIHMDRMMYFEADNLAIALDN